MPTTIQPARRPRAQSRISRLHKPDSMTLEAWQTELRRQFGQQQRFSMKNLGAEPIFSDFQVTNPQTSGSYRVSIRGEGLAENFCTCPDFATNTLGTCKHIEFVLARLRRRPGGQAALRAGFKPPFSEIVLHYGARRQVCFRAGSACPPALAVLAADYFDAQRVLRDDAFDRFEKFLADAARFQHDLRCHEDVLSFVAEIRDRQRRKERVAEAFARGIRSARFNKLLKIPLYDYQREGALFAARAGRCLIGDEMGLGKTIQALAAAEIMAELFGVERVLIVCPTSLKHQWEREIARFTNRSATVIGGLRPRREQHFAAESFYKIINYDIVHRDLDLIARWSPDLVILDEAQRIKNWNTRIARSVKRIDSTYAIVLTGTPLENRLEELVSIVEFVDRHRLGPTFKFLAEHQIHDEHGRVVGYRNLDSIGRTLAPVLIRRQKDQVLKQLPQRLDKNFFVPMTPQQMQHHDENREIVARIVAKWRRYRFLSEADQRRLMIALQNMRMSCDSTYLLDQKSDYGTKADELATLLDEVYERPNGKVVVFSQWVRMHEVLARRFERRKWDHLVFHGGVPSTQRRGLIDRFREDPGCRAFLATDAGGVGLNLQHASMVINVDLPWNPAVLEQRIGRVHRLGQRQPVRVVNFVSQGTIEEGMLSVLKFKKSLFAGALDGGANEVFLGGSRLNRFMESVEKASSAIPQATVEDQQAAAEAAAEPTAAAAEREQLEARADGRAMPAALPADPWAGLFQSGLAILQQFAVAARAPQRSPAAEAATGLSIVRRDQHTGESYLQIPMPAPDVLDRVLQSIGQVIEQFGKMRSG